MNYCLARFMHGKQTEYWTGLEWSNCRINAHISKTPITHDEDRGIDALQGFAIVSLSGGCIGFLAGFIFCSLLGS